jgi:multiple sugar transport system permease protein
MASETGTVGSSGVSLSPPVAQSQKVPARRKNTLHRYNPIVPYVFISPFVVLFVVFFLAPFFYDVVNSLYKAQHHSLFGGATIDYVGLANYGQALHDPDFWNGIKRVILFGCVQIPVMMGIALVLAMMMDSAAIYFRRFFRLAAFLPYAVPGVVATIMWGFIYSPRLSPITATFTQFGWPSPDFLGPNAILWSIANISTWTYTGFNMIIFFSALQAIPQEIYESGRLDGLSELGVSLRLKLPSIAPALVLGMLFSLVGTLQLFNEPKILQTISSGITSHFTPNMMAYDIAYNHVDPYYGGAIAAIMAIMTFIFSFGFLRLTRGQSGG